MKQREESLTEGIRDAASTLMEDVTKLGKATREDASALLERGQEKAHKLGAQAQAYVAKYPFRTLAVAVGAGFVLGFLKRRS
ncbi:MAG TPA: hypothetical protein VFX30_02140 [bacterium]|nr:hypothetical protein [bacterium]